MRIILNSIKEASTTASRKTRAKHKNTIPFHNKVNRSNHTTLLALLSQKRNKSDLSTIFLHLCVILEQKNFLGGLHGLNR